MPLVLSGTPTQPLAPHNFANPYLAPPLLPCSPIRSTLRSSQLPGSLVDELQPLTCLTALEIDSQESPLPPLQPLTMLSMLRQLALRDRGGCNFGAVLYPPPPASFPAGLQRFCRERS